MIVYPFLSQEWILAAAEIRDEYRDRVGTMEVVIRANVTVTEAPFADATIHGHVDTTGGTITLDQGHLGESDFHIEVRYEVARTFFIERDPQAMLSALLGGQVKLTGDSSKILGLAGMAAPAPDDSERSAIAREIARRIDAITERP